MPTKSDEPRLTLPAGHPQAGYLSPDLSFVDSPMLEDDETAEAREEANEARTAEVEAIAAHEHEVASAELKAVEERAAKDRERQEKVAKGEISQQQANEMRAAQASLDATAAPTEEPKAAPSRSSKT